jgi:DNA mismatch repair ATPase MutS
MNLQAEKGSATTYKSLLTHHTEKADELQQRLTILSFFRLFLFLAFIFFGYKAMRTGDHAFTIASLVSLVIFLIILRLYDRSQKKAAFHKALAKINSDEIDFLEGKPSVYNTGKDYIDPHHPYSYDLDIFGEGGLFPYLNRTSTSFGQETLAQSLLHPDKNKIRERQDAIRELNDKLEFRQHLQAYGMTQETKDKEMQQLRAWIDSPSFFSNKVLYYGLMIFPLATIGSLIYYFITENDKAVNLFSVLFVLNIIIAFSFARKISAHLSVSTSVNKILQQFASQLKLIESQPFQSPLLKQVQEQLKTGDLTASKSIGKLASLFNSLETIINLLVSILLNGLFLFHIHVLFALEKWKTENKERIFPWLKLLGEIEGLNSFANLSYNNPSFSWPSVTEKESLAAEDMGHLLIRPAKRITNSISFNEQPFVILTGSNMSGKSTFLRTLGINLVLARAGSAVCAKSFEFYPYDVQVSMRISDSLQDSESFFYAELKRLHQVIEQLEKGHKTFVILDEILRGTNSNDKHNGTVGLIRKMVGAHACGIIATHDLTVSRLAEEYPSHVSNKCFESRIINDELLFDYKLGDGVCSTLSASFLMKKMGII